MSRTMATIDPERQVLGEVEVIGQERWEEIRRRVREGASIRAIARALDLDRKTVRQHLSNLAHRQPPVRQRAPSCERHGGCHGRQVVPRRSAPTDGDRFGPGTGDRFRLESVIGLGRNPHKDEESSEEPTSQAGVSESFDAPASSVFA